MLYQIIISLNEGWSWDNGYFISTYITHIILNNYLTNEQIRNTFRVSEQFINDIWKIISIAPWRVGPDETRIQYH